MGLSIKKFYTSSTWVAPPGVTRVLVCIIGGGGGGGGGKDGNSTNTLSPGGGGGGGGAQEATGWVTVVPGRTYTVTVGAYGVGGANGTSPVAGTDGGDSLFIDSVTSDVLACGPGAQGGMAGRDGALAWGGMSCRPGGSLRPAFTANGYGLVGPGNGGWGSARGTVPSLSWMAAPGFAGGFPTGHSLEADEYPGVSGYGEAGTNGIASNAYAGGGGGGAGGLACMAHVDQYNASTSSNGGAAEAAGGSGYDTWYGYNGSGGGNAVGRPVGTGGAGGGAGGCGVMGGGTGGVGTRGGTGRVVIAFLC